MTDLKPSIACRTMNTKAVPCPHCGTAKGAVIDTRPTEDGVRRRRICGNCKQRYTTVEVLLADRPITMKTLTPLEDLSAKMVNFLHDLRNPPDGD